MTQMNKFENLNGRFTSLGTGMTQLNKFEDPSVLYSYNYIGKIGYETLKVTSICCWTCKIEQFANRHSASR